MNFYSHAVVASWLCPDRAFVLGAMLPDLCRMAGEKPLRADGTLGAGIRCHERADDVFHAHPEFRRLCSAAFEHLNAHGVGRGGAKAAAHIGVELLIDGALFDDEYGRTRYLATIETGPALLGPLGVSPALGRVLSSLKSRGAARDHTSPEAIARRIEYATRGRRRLALEARDLGVIGSWAESARDDVEASTPALIDDVANALGARRPESHVNV